jgi:predicted transcriptional regulator
LPEANRVLIVGGEELRETRGTHLAAWPRLGDWSASALQRPLASGGAKDYFSSMTDKQAVVDALQRLPENASLEEITEELHIMAAVRRGRADVGAGRTKTHEEAQKLVESWATAWTSK